MTTLSVNLNKIALLRNSRGRDFPNLLHFAEKFIDLGVKGITVHPRQDERHVRVQDVYDLRSFLKDKEVEFNVEGYPSESFLRLIEETHPTQATLVPDTPGQLTSDHGWELPKHNVFLAQTCKRITDAGIRCALFLDPDLNLVREVTKTGTDRIELYTESFAQSFGKPDNDIILENYRKAAEEAQRLGLGVNAGHDLDSQNLGKFLSIAGILEVSIGHVLTVECIERGIEAVTAQYLSICESSATP